MVGVKSDAFPFLILIYTKMYLTMYRKCITSNLYNLQKETAEKKAKKKKRGMMENDRQAWSKASNLIWLILLVWILAR